MCLVFSEERHPSSIYTYRHFYLLSDQQQKFNTLRCGLHACTQTHQNYKHIYDYYESTT